jgi:hypothetical protein
VDIYPVPQGWQYDEMAERSSCKEEEDVLVSSSQFDEQWSDGETLVSAFEVFFFRGEVSFTPIQGERGGDSSKLMVMVIDGE